VNRIASRIIVAVLCLVVAGAGAVVATAATGALPLTQATTIDPDPFQVPAPVPRAPVAGMAPAEPVPVADPGAIRQQLADLDRDGLGSVAYCVTDLAGTQVAVEDPQTARIPASSWKLVSASAVLAAYDADHRFVTVVRDAPGGIVLVGGGDPYLTAHPSTDPDQASAQDLADQVVAALAAQHRDSVTLGFDDTLFAGPAWNPAWTADLAWDVTAISALSIDPSGNGDVYSDTARLAASTFRDLLVARGITVTDLRRQSADPAATVLGQVESWPLARIVARVLTFSDNFGAEVLARQASLAAGGDGSPGAVQSALTDYLTSTGRWAPGVQVSDGSGLSLVDRAPACLLAGLITGAFDDPSLTGVLAGLPIAGLTGSLADRFDEADEAAGRGVVRAKTGTHDQVRTLTGFAQTDSGPVLAFSFILNNLDDSQLGIDWLDQAAAVLAEA
jgi:D-alanyl-D-alanine carboxypeptidase/D-alanyl-D-alanine-endopeptidase (penicillin-binding protein 4)